MANFTKLDSRQVVQKVPLNRLAPNAGPSPDRAEMDNILASIDSQVTPPLEMRASSPADQVLNIGAIKVQDPEFNFWRTIPPIGNVLPNISSETVTFPTSSGGSATPSSGDSITITVASGNFIKTGINLDSNGNLVLITGDEGGTVDAATVPPLISGTFPIGFVVLENQGGTIQSIENSDIFQYVGGGGGGSAGGYAKIFLNM